MRVTPAVAVAVVALLVPAVDPATSDADAGRAVWCVEGFFDHGPHVHCFPFLSAAGPSPTPRGPPRTVGGTSAVPVVASRLSALDLADDASPRDLARCCPGVTPLCCAGVVDTLPWGALATGVARSDGVVVVSRDMDLRLAIDAANAAMDATDAARRAFAEDSFCCVPPWTDDVPVCEGTLLAGGASRLACDCACMVGGTSSSTR